MHKGAAILWPVHEVRDLSREFSFPELTPELIDSC